MHEAADEAVLFSFSDRPVQEALQLFREERQRCLNRRRARAAAADQLTKTTDEILAEVQQLPAELIHWVPAEGVWTVMDNLCHIREFVPFWTGETLRIVRRPGEPWGRDHTDTARLAAVTNTAAHHARRRRRRHPRGGAPIRRDAEDAERRATSPSKRRARTRAGA